jgi:hypothetical protein
MTRRDRIILLLERYVDVQPGLVDTEGGDGGGGTTLLSQGAWKHRSYRQLEELCGRLRDEERELYWHLAETYFRATTKRASYCPRCRNVEHATLIGKPCSHGQRGRRNVSSDTRIATVARVVSSGVDARLVAAAIDWLEREWQGDVTIPTDLGGGLEARARTT